MGPGDFVTCQFNSNLFADIFNYATCVGANRSQIWFCRSVFDFVMSHNVFLEFGFFIFGVFIVSVGCWNTVCKARSMVGVIALASVGTILVIISSLSHICILESLTFRLYPGWVGIWCWDIFNWCRDFYTRTISGGRRWETRIGFHFF